ncbi:expressed unknown protein (Partial), partial [Seminavis robusta]|eukprot:Sro4581_g354270.1 n/a (142) ;mRNA; r:2-536
MRRLLLQLLLLSGVSLVSAFSSASAPLAASSSSTAATLTRSRHLSATKSPEESTASAQYQSAMTSILAKEYTEDDLKDALQGLLSDSLDPEYDARHIFGHGDPNHTLSMLQKITATRIKDYVHIMSNSESPSEEQLLQQARD